MEVSGQVHAPASSIPMKDLTGRLIHWRVGWLSPRV